MKSLGSVTVASCSQPQTFNIISLSLCIPLAWYFLFRVSLFEPPHDKTNKKTVRPAKTQISMGICPVWSESSLCAQWVAKDPSFLHADSKDSDQTGGDAQAGQSLCWTHSHFVGFVTRWFIFSETPRGTADNEKVHSPLFCCHGSETPPAAERETTLCGEFRYLYNARFDRYSQWCLITRTCSSSQQLGPTY